MNTTKRISKDTILMSSLLVAALLTVGAASVRSTDELRARDAALMVVKSATLIASSTPAPAAPQAKFHGHALA